MWGWSMRGVFINVWSPNVLGEPLGWCGQLADRSVSVCLVTSWHQGRSRQSDAQEGKEPFISLIEQMFTEHYCRYSNELN